MTIGEDLVIIVREAPVPWWFQVFAALVMTGAVLLLFLAVATVWSDWRRDR